jgi:HK97 family phage prohead protease
MNKLDTHFSIKTLEDIGMFSGYASVYNLVDAQEEWVAPGAFDASLEDSSRPKPKLLWQHDPKEPIGEWTSITSDDRGLFVKGQLFLEVQRAKEAHIFLKSGVVDGLSIGYTPLKVSNTPKGRRLDAVALEEISLVTFPSNPEARVQAVKQGEESSIVCICQKIQSVAAFLREKN